MPREVSMPTQIPLQPEFSWAEATKTTLLDSMLVGAIIGVIFFAVVWAYT
jgi:hypothetical protein